MDSYFVARAQGKDGCNAVHERSRCPPACFRAPGASEYLGDFLDAGQALLVARLRYVNACACAHCDAPVVPAFALAGTRALLPALGSFE